MSRAFGSKELPPQVRSDLESEGIVDLRPGEWIAGQTQLPDTTALWFFQLGEYRGRNHRNEQKTPGYLG